MTIERLDKETDRRHENLAPARVDNNSVDAGQTDELKEPLKFVSTRLRKKMLVRRAINESHPRQDGALGDLPRS